MTTVASFGPWYTAHEIVLTSKENKVFRMVIGKFDTENNYFIEASIDDEAGRMDTRTIDKFSSPSEAFEAGISKGIEYFIKKQADDYIVDVHNPCNCPFIAEIEQKVILVKLKQAKANVRVN